MAAVYRYWKRVPDGRHRELIVINTIKMELQEFIPGVVEVCPSTPHIPSDLRRQMLF